MNEVSRREIHDRDEWNNTLAQLPHAHILQSWEWGDFKHRTTGWAPRRWIFSRDDVVVAAASVGVRSFGPFCLMYAPKGPAMDYANTDNVQAVLTNLEREAARQNAIMLKIDPDVAWATGVPGEESDAIAQPGHDLREMLRSRGYRFSDEQIQFRNTLTLDLAQSEDDILMAMSSNTRRKVRTAEKKDVTIRQASLNDLDLLYSLYETTGERNEFLIRPREYYVTLWREFIQANLAHALIAEYESEPLAHVILFHFGATCWYFYGASRDIERNRMPTYALQWEAMRWAKAQGYRTYDFWGAPTEFTEDDPLWGVYQFKNGFRGTLERRLGAWDYAPRPWLYNLYQSLYPSVIALLRRWR